MSLIPTIRWAALLAILTLNSTIASAENDASKTYRCSAKDAVSLQNNGTLGKDPAAEFYRKRLDGMIIDTLTGAITDAYGNRDIWNVVQKGDTEYDHVLIPRDSLRSDAKEVAATAATDFIRIRAWGGDPQIKFMAFALYIFVTGTCEIVR